MTRFSSTLTTVEDTGLFEPLSKVAAKVAAMGHSLAVYDPSGRCVAMAMNPCEACERICGASGPCHRKRQEMLKQVWADEKPRQYPGPIGCVVSAVPVMKRRRMTAVAISCYLAEESAGSEELKRGCDTLHLDSDYISTLVAQGKPHPRKEGSSWLDMLIALLGQTMENSVARVDLASFSSNLSNTYEELSLLYRLSGAMKVNVTPDDFFEHVCAELIDVLQVECVAAVLSPREQSNQIGRVILAGENPLEDEKMGPLVEDIRKYDPDEGARGVVINQIKDISPQWLEHLGNLVAVPLVAGDLHMGMVLAMNRAKGEFDSADLKLIHSVAVQGAVFLANHHLYGEVQGLLMGILHVLTASIDAKDQYTCGHSLRVALISRKLAEMLNFSPEKIENIYLSGLLHDIGKIGVPESVLCKPGKLSEEEFEIMRRHPVIGANILSNIRQIQPVLAGVMHHHERIDGRGYPDGLSGDQVPLEGRIVGIADSFDAMTSSRTYRQALPLEFVVAEIMRCSGTQFDPDLVDCLLGLDLKEFMEELRNAKPLVSTVGGVIKPLPA